MAILLLIVGVIAIINLIVIGVNTLVEPPSTKYEVYWTISAMLFFPVTFITFAYYAYIKFISLPKNKAEIDRKYHEMKMQKEEEYLKNQAVMQSSGYINSNLGGITLGGYPYAQPNIVYSNPIASASVVQAPPQSDLE